MTGAVVVLLLVLVLAFRAHERRQLRVLGWSSIRVKSNCICIRKALSTGSWSDERNIRWRRPRGSCRYEKLFCRFAGVGYTGRVIVLSCLLRALRLDIPLHFAAPRSQESESPPYHQRVFNCTALPANPSPFLPQPIPTGAESGSRTAAGQR